MKQMKVSMNWGSWIVVSFIIFALGTFVMVYISMSSNNDLVTEDYYVQELKYQQHIEAVNNTHALNQNVTIEITSASIMLRFPKIEKYDRISGNVHFFRPSDKRGDRDQMIHLDSNHSMSSPLGMFTSGLWRAKISWTVQGHHYYSELPFIIQ